jgi:hypothetical protein
MWITFEDPKPLSVLKICALGRRGGSAIQVQSSFNVATSFEARLRKGAAREGSFLRRHAG